MAVPPRLAGLENDATFQEHGGYVAPSLPRIVLCKVSGSAFGGKVAWTAESAASRQIEDSAHGPAIVIPMGEHHYNSLLRWCCRFTVIPYDHRLILSGLIARATLLAVKIVARALHGVWADTEHGSPAVLLKATRRPQMLSFFKISEPGSD